MSFTKSDRRTHYCTALTEENIGQRVTVNGWCAKQRNLGTLIFIDLRDRTGIIQLAFDEKSDRAVFETAASVRTEYVLTATGVVRSRGADVNESRETGRIEIYVDEMKILCTSETTPFEIIDDKNIRSDLRMQYRYLDLRRPTMTKNIIARSEITRLTIEYFMNNGFLYI